MWDGSSVQFSEAVDSESKSIPGDAGASKAQLPAARPKPSIAPTPKKSFPGKRAYTIRRGDTLLATLQRHLGIGPGKLRLDIRDELADFVDLRAMRPGHQLVASFATKTGRLRTLTYRKSPIHRWVIQVCWQEDSCYGSEKTHSHGRKTTPEPRHTAPHQKVYSLSPWMLETRQMEVAKLVQLGIRLKISKKTPSFTVGLRQKKEKGTLASIARRVLGSHVHMHRVFGGEELDLLIESLRYQGRSYGYGQVLMARYRGRKKRQTIRVYYEPPRRSRLGVGFFYPDGRRSVKEQFFSVPTRPFRVGSRRYGMRFHPILRRMKMHWGIDTRSPCGQRIYAVASGRVITRGWRGGAGKMVSIRHSNGWVSRYMHLRRFAIRRGARVRKGQLIGYVGTTGRSTGCHLHFELLRWGRHVNPLKVIHLQFQRRLSCRAMVDFWKTHVQRCKILGLGVEACGLSIPRHCYRRYRMTFWRKVRAFCASSQGGRCSHPAPRRWGQWPFSQTTARLPAPRIHRKKVRHRRRRRRRYRHRRTWEMHRLRPGRRYRRARRFGRVRRYRRVRRSRRRNRWER